MAKLQLSRRKGSRIFRNGRSRSARTRCQEPADKGREYGQASAEPAEGIQDLQGWPQPEHQGRVPGPADNGRKYGQASAEPAVGIQIFRKTQPEHQGKIQGPAMGKT